MMNVVGDEDHRDPARPRLRDVAQDDASFLHAERCGWLVQYQDLGTEIDRAGNGHRLAFTAGERTDRLLRIADVDSHLGSSSRVTWSARFRSKRLNGPQPLVGSVPRKKFREMLISGIMARSW